MSILLFHKLGSTHFCLKHRESLFLFGTNQVTNSSSCIYETLFSQLRLLRSRIGARRANTLTQVSGYNCLSCSLLELDKCNTHCVHTNSRAHIRGSRPRIPIAREYAESSSIPRRISFFTLRPPCIFALNPEKC